MQKKVTLISSIDLFFEENPPPVFDFLGNPYSPVWQTPLWNAFISQTGLASEGILVELFRDTGEPLARVIFEKRTLGLSALSGLFCIGGPWMYDQVEENIFPAIEGALRAQGLLRHVVFLQYEPFVCLPGANEKSYKRFLFPKTACVNLQKPLEEIRASMKQKGRYNAFKIAQDRFGIQVKEADLSLENAHVFYELLHETTARNNFSQNTLVFFEKLFSFLHEQKKGKLFLAYDNEKVAAAAVVVTHEKTAWYYYGASSSDPEIRKKMASYLLQWEIIASLHEYGFLTYDLLGTDSGGTHNSVAGVRDFKLRICPNEISLPPSHLSIISPFWFFILKTLQKIKHLIHS